MNDFKPGSIKFSMNEGKKIVPVCLFGTHDIFDKKINMSRIVYQSDNFFVIPTLGQFINGYLLIIPISHIMSNAELDSSLREEFLTVLDDITYILELTYHTSNFLVWENGTGNSGIGKVKQINII